MSIRSLSSRSHLSYYPQKSLLSLHEVLEFVGRDSHHNNQQHRRVACSSFTCRPRLPESCWSLKSALCSPRESQSARHSGVRCRARWGRPRQRGGESLSRSCSLSWRDPSLPPGWCHARQIGEYELWEEKLDFHVLATRRVFVS